MSKTRLLIQTICLLLCSMCGSNAAERTFYFSLPLRADEGSGDLNQKGWVYTSEPVLTDLTVQLETDPLLHVPASVTIPAGYSSTSFSMSVGDDAIYHTNYQAVVVAKAEGWLDSEGRIQITDDDDPSFTFTAPEYVFENHPGEGEIRLRAPRAHSIIVQLVTADNPGFTVPASVIVPVGQTIARFPVTYQSTTFSGTLYAGISDVNFWLSAPIISLPDNPVPQNLFFWDPPPNVPSGTPIHLKALLGTSFNVPQNTNAVGELRLVDPAAQILFTQQTIQFTNGIWAGDIVLEGIASELQFELSAVGFTRRTPFFDLVRSHVLNAPVIKAQWNTQSQMFYVLIAQTTNAPARLAAVGPLNPSVITNFVDLPAEPVAMSVSDDATTAWLALPNNKFLRVDLNAWTAAQPLDAPGRLRDILLLPGLTENFVAVISGDDADLSDWQVKLFTAGVEKGTAGSLPFNPNSFFRMAELVRGRNASEAFCKTAADLFRFDVDDGIQASARVELAAGPGTVRYSEGKLYHSAGQVFDAATLAETQHYQVPDSTLAMVPFPHINRIYEFQASIATVRDLGNGNALDSRPFDPIVPPLTDPAAIFSWDRGFAFKTQFGLIVIESPLVTPRKADLALRFLGPANYTNSTSGFFANSIPWEFEVENLGPDVAFYVSISGNIVGTRLGTLLPGEKRRVTALVNEDNAFLQDDVYAISPMDDPNPTNNYARALTVVQMAPQILDGHAIPMNVSALASSPDRQRVYAAYSLRPGAEGPGIAVLDGASATIQQTLATPATVLRMEVTTGEKFLFGLVQTDLLQRWNLETGIIDQTITSETGPILDFAVVSDDTVVIATPGRVSVFKAGVELPSFLESATSQKSLKVVNGTLWLVEDYQLGKVQISQNGLAVVDGPFSLPNFDQLFVPDGDLLYFNTSTFNTITHEITVGPRNGLPLVFPEIATLITQAYDRLRIVRRDDFQLVAEEPLPPNVFIWQAVRFGERGIAFAGQRSELLLYNVAGLPLPLAPADLAVTVAAPTLYSEKALTWEFTVTNNSDAPALNARLAIFPGAYKWSVEGGNDMTTLNSSTVALGNLAPHEIKKVRFTTWFHPWFFQLVARTFSNSPDPSYENNVLTFTGTPELEPSYLRVSIDMPERAALGDIITIISTVENAGPTPLEQVQLNSSFGGQFLAQVPSSFSLAVGEKKIIQVQAKISQAGLLTMWSSAGAPNYRNSDILNSAAKLLFVPDAATPFESLALPGEILIGNSPRNELIAVLTLPSAVAGLDPRTFEPHWVVPVSSYVTSALPTSDGRYVWIPFSGGRVARIDIDTRQVDLDFAVADYEGSFWSVASPPAQPNILLVSYSDYQVNRKKTAAFKDGVELPDGFDTLGRLAVGAEGRIFFAGSGLSGLQELALNQTGLSVVTTFNTGESIAPITAVGTKIFFAGGPVFDVATGAINNSLPPAASIIAGPGADRVWRMYAYLGRSYLESYDIVSGRVDWRVTLPPESQTLAVVGNRAVVTATQLRHAAYELTLPNASDLTVLSDMPASVSAPGLPFIAQLTATNKTAWLAGDVKVALDLPPGTMVLDPATGWVETNQYEVLMSNPVTHELEILDPPHSVTLKLAKSGPQEIVARVSGTAPELNPADNTVHFPLTVAPLPVFLIDDIAMSEAEGSETTGWVGITALLTAPAPRDIEIDFTVSPIDGDINDIAFPQSAFVFYAGRSDAFASVFYNDTAPELPERFRIDFTPNEITMVRTQTVVTLLNDDFPVISAPPTVRVAEGNVGIQTIVLNVARGSAPFPSEVDFQTVSGTALANRDFVPVSGRLLFAPGERNKTVEIGIVSNTEFDPEKQFTLELKNPLGATISPAATAVIIRPDDLPPPFETTISHQGPATYVEFQALPGVKYQLEYKRTVDDFLWLAWPVAPQITGSTGRFAMNLAGPIFMRVKATLQ